MKTFFPLLSLALALSTPAFAQQEPPDAGQLWASCTEHLPPGATRPQIEEVFPQTGLSGYAANLEVTVTHGKGETVLPEGFKLQSSGDAARAIQLAGFVIPEPDAGSGPSLSTQLSQDKAVTKVVIPFVPLPKDPGRNSMLLPPVPIAVSRASGEQVTICTQPHEILVEDPIANDPDPKVKPNPPPRPQREEWVFAKQLSMGILIGTLVGLLLAWLTRRWLRKPKFVPPAPPKLPWITALEELEAIRQTDLLIQGQTDEYFDRVSDCVRKYLGARYGFDGLETTSDEMRTLLKRVRPKVPILSQISQFLADCDLVKFARVQPTESDCLDALSRGEMIVHRTTPPAVRPEGTGLSPPSRRQPPSPKGPESTQEIAP